LDDPHQVISLIATAICDWRKDQSDQALSQEQNTWQNVFFRPYLTRAFKYQRLTHPRKFEDYKDR
jgi:hypothetical protein